MLKTRNTIDGGKTLAFGLLLALFALLASAPATAQVFSPTGIAPFPQRTVAQIGSTCTAAQDGSLYMVRDALNVNTCATGGGTAAALCLCDAGVWRILGAVNATTATLASTVTVADGAGDTTAFPAFFGSATGSLPALTDAGITANLTANSLTATTFVGALTGNASTATAATTASGVPISATAPSVCDVSTSLGFLYVDTTGPDLCYCPGAAGWTASDGSGTCE